MLNVGLIRVNTTAFKVNSPSRLDTVVETQHPMFKGELTKYQGVFHMNTFHNFILSIILIISVFFTANLCLHAIAVHQQYLEQQYLEQQGE